MLRGKKFKCAIVEFSAMETSDSVCSAGRKQSLEEPDVELQPRTRPLNANSKSSAAKDFHLCTSDPQQLIRDCGLQRGLVAVVPNLPSANLQWGRQKARCLRSGHLL